MNFVALKMLIGDRAKYLGILMGLTFASLLIQQGEGLAYIKEQMGHSSIDVTVDIYGHLVPGGNRQANKAGPDADVCCVRIGQIDHVNAEEGTGLARERARRMVMK